MTSGALLRTGAGALLALAVGCTRYLPAPAGEAPAATIVRGGGGELRGAGSLRQESVALRVQFRGVLTRAIPLDPWVTDLLAEDSRRSLLDLAAARADDLERARRSLGEEALSVWYVTYYALEPDSRFAPSEVGITSSGRTFAPLQVLPLSAGFSENRLQQGESQSALYLFSGSLDLTQPLVLGVEGVQTAEWERILLLLDRERERVRGTRRDTAHTPTATLN